MAYENNDKQPTPVTGVLGTTFGATALAAATGILGGNGMGGLFGGNQNPAASPIYQLAQKDAEITRLQAEKYSDNKVAELTKEVSVLSQRVAAIEVAEPLREQIIMQNVNSLQNTINRLVQPMIPNGNIAPGWGPAFVSPFPPIPPVVPAVQGGTSTTTPTTTASAA